MIVSDDMRRHVAYVLFVYLNAVIVVAAYSQDESTAFLPKPTTANTQSILTSYGATNISSNNTTSTTTEESTEENVVYDDLYYTRLIPALSTIGIFLIGLLVIYISYCMKQRKDYTKKVIESDNLDSDWLQQLKKTQKKGFLRRKSPFQTKLLSQDRKTILKKYALYDEMLASYKQSLKMQKLNSIRKANVTSSSNQSQVTNEGTPLRRVNSKMRMKELAMSHKHFHEQRCKLLEWEASSSFGHSEDDEHTEEEGLTTKSNLTKRIEKLPTVSFQLPTDDDYYGDGDTELLLLGTSHLKGTEGSVKDCGMEEQEKDDVNLQTDKQLIHTPRMTDHLAVCKRRPMCGTYTTLAAGDVAAGDVVVSKNAIKKKDCHQDGKTKHSNRKRPRYFAQQPNDTSTLKSKDSRRPPISKFLDIPIMESSLNSRPRSIYDNVPNDVTEQLHENEAILVTKNTNNDCEKLSEKEENAVFDGLERKMIENVHRNILMEKQGEEITALENLLNDVARFCTEYSEEFGETKSRRQISFTEANATFSRSTSSCEKKPAFEHQQHNVDRRDGRKGKAISIYETNIQEKKNPVDV